MMEDYDNGNLDDADAAGKEDSHKERLQNIHKEAGSDANREQLVQARRERQQGRTGSRGNPRLATSLAILSCGVALVMILVGPQKLFGSLFGSSPEMQRSSEIDMNVAAERADNVHLDFVVPGAPEPEPQPDTASAALKTQIQQLQDEIARMSEAKAPGMTDTEIQTLLDRQGERLSRKFEQQQQALSKENERLRQQALELAAAQQAATSAATAAAMEKLRRESNSVVVDDAIGPAGAYMTTAGARAAADTAEMTRDHKFLEAAGSEMPETSVSTRLYDPSRTVVQGTIISAVLETAINTELPGSLRATVTEPVFAFDGSRVVMPQGTLLIGQFNEQVSLEQRRVQIAWSRAITPDGHSVSLGSIGTDRLGRSGTAANVNNRYGKKLGAAALLTTISAIPTLLSQNIGGVGSKGNNSGTTINVGAQDSGGAGGLAEQVSSSLGEHLGAKIEDYLDLPPIIQVPQGEDIRVYVNRDLIFR